MKHFKHHSLPLQVHLRIRGQLAACSGKNELYEDVPRSSYRDYCGFKYGDAATPTVAGVNPGQVSGDATITISGAGFSEVVSENIVLFGEMECAVLSSSTTSIECRLGTQNGFAGFKGLYVHVLYSGVAESNGMGIVYELVLTSVSPCRGSQTGGTDITIMGSGFYHESGSSEGLTLPSYIGDIAATCASGWRNQVFIGGRPCTVVQSDRDTLTVKTPAEGAGSVSPHDLEVLVQCPDSTNNPASAVLPDAFTYDPVFTPSVFAITPSVGAIQGGQIVTINGEGFSSNSLENQVSVSCAFILSTGHTKYSLYLLVVCVRWNIRTCL